MKVNRKYINILLNNHAHISVERHANSLLIYNWTTTRLLPQFFITAKLLKLENCAFSGKRL